MSSNGTKSTGKIWTIAAVVGVIAFVVLKWWVHYALWPALLLAILIAILVAILLWIGFYRGADETEFGTPIGSSTAPAASATTSATSAPSSSADSPSAASFMGSPEANAAKAQDAGATAAKPEVAASTASVSSETSSADAKPASTAKKAAPKKTAAKKPAAKKTTSAAPGGAAAMMGDAGKAMASEKKAAKAKPARKPVAKDGKPETLSKPRAGGADDLKQIKGVGPGLEKTLNELGFYHFDQVAGWRKKEVEWVDSRLKFKGRIERDGWVKQCKTLAKGGSTAFSKRVKKGDVYKDN